MTTQRAPARRPGRWLTAPAVGVALVAGVWVAGGLITDSFRASMALTAAWFALALAACLLLGRRHPALRAPLLAGYVLTAAGVGGYLGYSTLHDRVVDERVVVGTPASRLSAELAGRPRPRRAVAVEQAAGRFRAGEHATAGTARVVSLHGGRRVLTLTRFATSAGPDLRVRLAPGPRTDGGGDGVLDLGALKGNRGDQQYTLPAAARGTRWTVLIWCRAFSALFGAATLRPA